MKKNIHNRTILPLFLIAVFGLIAYSNTFESSFHFDDKPDIIQNPLIKDFKYFINLDEAREKILSEGDHLGAPSFFTRYIAQLTFAVNYHIHELDVTGYHIVNLAIHLINALLVYFIILFTFRTPLMRDSVLEDRSGLISMFSALLFALHPIQTQAVTYIVQRYASLATMFYLLALFTYICSRLAHRKWKSTVIYVLCILSAAAGMITKEIVFTLPFAVLMYDLFFFKGDFKSRIPRLSLILLTAFIIPLAIFTHNTPSEDVATSVDEATRYGADITRLEYLCTQFRVLATYIRLIFLPINQNLDYDYPVYDSFLSLPALISFLFLLSIFSSGIYLLYKSKKNSGLKLVSFGILWFFITISIESSIIPLPDVIYEHRMYLPSMGVFLALTTAIFMVIKRWKVHTKVITAMLVVIITVLTGATYARNSVWKDDLALWQDVVNKSPDKARGHNNLGKVWNDNGIIDKANEHYRIAIELDPNYSDAHYNLGIAFMAQGLTDNAIRQYQKAIKFDPYYSKAYNNLGIAYAYQRLIDKAIEQYLTAIKINRYDSDAIYNLGIAYGKKDMTDEAIEQYRHAILLEPMHKQAHFNLGVAYIEKGLIVMAQKEFEKQLQINPQHNQARLFLRFTRQSNGMQ